MKSTPDINEALNVLTRHGIEWGDIHTTRHPGYQMELYRNGGPSGDLLLTPSILRFNYKAPIETVPNVNTPYILISVEEGGFFDRLPERFSQPSKFTVYYARDHYHMLKELERQEIPPQKVKTEIDADQGHFVVVTHNMGSLDARKRVCIELDEEIAPYFPQARHQEVQGYIFIHGDGEREFDAVPRLPEGYDNFGELNLVFNFRYPRPVKQSKIPYFRKKYLPHLHDIPLPNNSLWSFEDTLSRDTRWHITWSGREHPMGRTVKVSSWKNPVAVSDRIEDDINAVNTLLASMKPVS